MSANNQRCPRLRSSATVLLSFAGLLVVALGVSGCAHPLGWRRRNLSSQPTLPSTTSDPQASSAPIYAAASPNNLAPPAPSSVAPTIPVASPWNSASANDLAPPPGVIAAWPAEAAAMPARPGAAAMGAASLRPGARQDPLVTPAGFVAPLPQALTAPAQMADAQTAGATSNDPPFGPPSSRSGATTPAGGPWFAAQGAVWPQPLLASAASAEAPSNAPPPGRRLDFADPLVDAQAIEASRSSSRKAEDVPPPPGRVSLEDRLKIPPEMPGANAAQIQLPPLNLEHPQARSAIVDKLFPDPPQMQTLTPPRPDVRGTAMTLAQLQDIAIRNAPELQQAAGDVTAAFGNAVQEGTHPNPTIGYEGDTVGSAGTRNYQGVMGTQTIKTAGKLRLARTVANFDAMNAQLDYRKTRAQLLTNVRNGYFAVLVAQESVAINTALVRFTTEVYRIQVDKLKFGAGTGYEPAQLRTLAYEARAALVQAQNRYVSAWKQLAATMGVPEMPPTELEGRADMPAPQLNYDAILSYVINNHPDVLAGRNDAAQARTNLRLQQITPIPDVQLYGTFQRDFTTPYLGRTVYNVQFGVPVPIFDRNRGGIIQAEGQARRASEEMRRARNALTSLVSDAFERFETNRVQSEYYREQILPDLARAYRGIYQRHQQESVQVGFGDVIVAQQNLATAVSTYIVTLGGQWMALADIANLMQLDDLWSLYGQKSPDLKIDAGMLPPVMEGTGK